MATDHTQREHAILSASGAHRWLACPPSARLEGKFGPDKALPFAEEGTLAHEMANVKLDCYNGTIDQKAAEKELKKLRKNKLYKEEMDAYVDEYVKFVTDLFESVKQTCSDAVLFIERKLDFSRYVPDGFGTGDAIIIADGTMYVIDLKYGKGVRVAAEGNPQAGLYALGALAEFAWMYKIEKVSTIIFQPRIQNVSQSQVEVPELEKWGEKVHEIAQLAYAGKGEKQAGDHCKFCKVKGTCRALAMACTEGAEETNFADGDSLSDTQLLAIYRQADMIRDWVAGIEEHILRTAVDGKSWPGLKVVEGRTIRKWGSEEVVILKLKELGFTEDQFIQRKLAGIGDIERLIGKDVFKSSFAAWVIKPEGVPTLAPASDPRPAFSSAEQAAKQFNENPID